MEAESYGNDQIASFIDKNFLPVTINIKQAPAIFHRFDALWTPSAVFLDSSGKERYRIEGYLPRKEFAAQLALALGRIAFTSKQWVEAEEHYNSVLEKCEDTSSAAEAIYWAGVAHYKKTNDHTVLGRVAQQLAEKHPDSLWGMRASPWLPAELKTKTA